MTICKWCAESLPEPEATGRPREFCTGSERAKYQRRKAEAPPRWDAPDDEDSWSPINMATWEAEQRYWAARPELTPPVWINDLYDEAGNLS
jgi:hypothetical protein